MNTKIVKLDINRNLYDILTAKQGDTQSRFLLFQLLDGAIPFSLENRSVKVFATKPDGKEVFNDLIINDRVKGYCTLELTNQMLAVPGLLKLELMVIEGDKKLTTNVFYMDVKKSINSENAIVSTNEFSALLNGLASLNEYDNYKNEIAAARDGEVNLLTKVKKIDEHLDNIANKGTTIEVLERVTKEEINRQIADGTIANLTIADGSITQEKLSPDLKLGVEDGGITGEKLDDEVKKSTYIISNKIKNYKLDNIDNWSCSYSNLSTENNELLITGIGSGYGGSNQYYADYDTKIKGLNGHKLYVNYNYNVLGNNISRVRLRLKSGTNTMNILDNSSVIGNIYNKFSKIIEIPSDYTESINYGIAVNFSDRESATGIVTKLRDIIIVDLTEVYGAGNEPTLDEFEGVLNYEGNYFGSINLFNAKETSVKVKELDNTVNNLEKDIILLARNYLSGMKNDMWGATETTVSGTGTSSKLTSYVTTEFVPGNEQVLYFKVKAKVIGEGCIKLQATINGNSGSQKTYEIENPISNMEYELSLSDSLLHHKGTSLNVSINAIFPDNDTQNGKSLVYSNGVLLNLTEIFELNNEPPKNIIDNLLTKFPNNHFYNTENIFSGNVLKCLKNDIYSHMGEYVKTHSLGNFSMSSVPNPNWDKWQSAQYSYGMSKHTEVPIYNYVHGTLETDSMFSVHAKYSRWSPDCVYSTEGGHQWGGHIFEGWNRPRTYRYTVLIGKNAVNETCIFTFAPPSPEVEGEEGGGGTFGITRVGSDKPKEGFEIKQKEAIMNGSLKITEKLMIPYKNITTSTTEGVRGQFAHNDNYLFLCVNDNYWKRVPLESF